MNLATIAFFSPYYFSFLLSGWVTLYCWRRSNETGAKVYSWVSFFQAFWTLGYILELLSPTLASKLFWDDFQLIGAIGWLIAFVFFTIHYTDWRFRHQHIFLGIILSPAVITLIYAFTDRWHHRYHINPRIVESYPVAGLMYEFDPILDVFFTYSTLLFTVYLFALVSKYFKTHSIFRAQVSFIFVGNLIPFAGIIVTYLDLLPLVHRDLSPFTFAVGNLIVAWGFYRFRLFDLVPLAREIIIENLQDAFVIVDIQNRVIDFNPVARAIGVRQDTPLIGRPLSEAFPNWVQLIEQNQDFALHEIESAEMTPNGTRHFDLRIQPLNDQYGNIKGRVIVRRDITEKTLVEHELREYQAGLEETVRLRTAELSASNEELRQQISQRQTLELQLRESQKMEAIGRLAGGIAHDFNNLLTVILGNAEIGIESNSASHEQFDEIRKAAIKASELTRQLLSFGRRQVLQMKFIDVNDAIIDVMKMIARILGEDIALKTDLMNEKVSVLADTGQLQQVIINLCTNARHAMPLGGNLLLQTRLAEADSVPFEVSSRPDSGFFVEISIQDTGVGMDASTLAQIFEPFFTTKEIGKGTGLGLSVVYGIVKQHGGHIHVESHPGEGSAFRLYFPSHLQLAQQDTPPMPSTPHSGKGNILLVEDEEFVRDMLVRLLGRLGYSVQATETPELALELFGADPSKVDLVISDVVMPNMSGPDLYLEMRKLKSSLPVLFVTGYDAGHQLMELPQKANGVYQGVLQKPFRRDELSEKLNEVFGNTQDTAG